MSQFNFLTNLFSSFTMAEQKSDAWFKERQTMITGSEVFKAYTDITTLSNCKIHNYQNNIDEMVELTHVFYPSDKQNNYINNKISPAPFESSAAMEWGTMMEDVSRTIHEHRTKLQFKEYGLIPHKTCSFFGASPDGMSTTENIALEIKNAYGSRLFFNNKLKLDYWFQCQWVMYCMNSWVCDESDRIKQTHFLETRFCRYNSFDEYIEDGGDTGYNTSGMEKGLLINVNGKIIYPTQIGCPIQQMGFTDEQLHRGTPIFWSLIEYNLVGVYEDQRMETEIVPELKRIWAHIQDIRFTMQNQNDEENEENGENGENGEMD